MPFNRLPDVKSCCGCVPDLRAATAIIAILGIVTSPSVSWAVIRHSYVIRVSCLISSGQDRPDVVDINLRNVLSFGLGPNAGLGPSCLETKKTNITNTEIVIQGSPVSHPKFLKAVQVIGWIVLTFDVIFVLCSLVFLVQIYHSPNQILAKAFMVTAMITICLSFVYSMIYIAACTTMGGAFPIFEFIFAFIDLLIWAYFVIVVNSYRRRFAPPPLPLYGRTL